MCIYILLIQSYYLFDWRSNLRELNHSISTFSEWTSGQPLATNTQKNNATWWNLYACIAYIDIYAYYAHRVHEDIPTLHTHTYISHIHLTHTFHTYISHINTESFTVWIIKTIDIYIYIYIYNWSSQMLFFFRALFRRRVSSTAVKSFLLHSTVKTRPLGGWVGSSVSK